MLLENIFYLTLLCHMTQFLFENIDFIWSNLMFVLSSECKCQTRKHCTPPNLRLWTHRADTRDSDCRLSDFLFYKLKVPEIVTMVWSSWKTTNTVTSEAAQHNTTLARLLPVIVMRESYEPSWGHSTCTVCHSGLRSHWPVLLTNFVCNQMPQAAWCGSFSLIVSQQHNS